MALVTVQRSPSAGSPQCSNSDGEAEDEENSKNDKSECFFAGKGTALVLALKEIPPNAAERRLSTDSTRSTNSTQSNSSDIQLHLQSMFNLLRHEETLKMAVKLESQRPNRTRYLVIASRCCYRAATTTERRSKISRHNSSKSHANNEAVAAAAAAVAAVTTAAAATVTTTAAIGAISGSNTPPSQRHSINMSDTQSLNSSSVGNKSQMDVADSLDAAEKRLSVLSNCSSSNRQSVKCDLEKNCAAGDGKNLEGIEESCLLGIDCNERTTIGLVVPILADTTIHLDGDGGFSVTVFGKTHIFKPVSVQAMWSALQTLHKVSQKARETNFYPGGPSHDWLSYYEQRIESEQSCLNEWNAMDSIESRRPPSPDAIRNKPTAKAETESVIKMKLKEIMMSVDLDEVTSKYIRGRLEEHLDMDLGEYKSFIDAEMLIILGQMDAPTEIFEHVYLGSEWNASNLEELQKNGVRHILNVTREIDNFFPGMFDYFNVRVYDDEKTNLLKHWDNTYRYITRAKAEGSKVLVHCKMGVSRSASVVIAYAMKEYNWEFQQALQHVKGKRNCIKPNKNFLNQLETYRGMLDAMKNKEKLQRSKSETNLKSTKDARLLPGSEPTPLIQALNHSSKSKSAGQSVSGTSTTGAAAITAAATAAELSLGNATVRSLRGRNNNCDHKQRLAMRRSSSISPKATSPHANAGIVLKQQSQSMENLTPERNVADEPRNVRFPGSNGENYSVTPNQVLHIQKNTPPPPPPLPSSTTNAAALAAALQAHSVKNIVQDLETHRKTANDRKSMNLQIARSISHDAAAPVENSSRSVDAADVANNSSVKSLGSPVWTASTKLITQTTNLAQRLDEHGVARVLTTRNRHDTSGSATSDSSDVFSTQLDSTFAREEEKRNRRKTQSWAANSGSGIIMDASTNALAIGSNSSLDSAASSCANSGAVNYESMMRTRTHPRELPSRHASWGSGDTRGIAAARNSSWTAYDSNRNTFQFCNAGSIAAPPAAIVEGQIHELNTSYKTATTTDAEATQQQQQKHIGTVKRTKQKLQECTALKKLCQEENVEEQQTAKRVTSLHRSASAAGATHAHFPQRCNSDEAVTGNVAGCGLQLQRAAGLRRSEGSRPLKPIELLSASAPEAYTMSDIENKNAPMTATDVIGIDQAVEDDDTASVVLRAGIDATTMEEQRISGNVQILKKNFEAKAVGTMGTQNPITAATTVVVVGSSSSSKKGHQSLPSSPVAQHAEHHNCGETATKNSSSTSSTGCNSSSSSSVSETLIDRNVKGLVHKYQATTTSVSTPAANTTTSTVAAAAPAIGSHQFHKPRPRSCYENASTTNRQIRAAYNKQHSQQHDYSDSRPPPVPVKHSHNMSAATSSNHPHTHTPAESLHQHQHTHPPQQRRLQQHGKTHPLARLSLSKTFNATAAAYNTILLHQQP